MTNRNPFDDIPDLVPAAPVARPAPPPMSNAPALPPIESPSAAPSDPPGPIDFGAAFDLEVVPKAAPVPAFSPSVQPPLPAPSAPPPQRSLSSPSVPLAPSSHPGTTSGAPIPPVPSSHPGFAPPSDPGFSEAPQASQRAPIVTREQLQDAARRASEVSREVAGKTRDAAVAAALRSVGHNQEKSIRIEDPSTWVKPMLGPIVALGIAIVFAVIAMVAGVPWLRYVAIICVLGAIGFGVARWFKLQADN